MPSLSAVKGRALSLLAPRVWVSAKLSNGSHNSVIPHGGHKGPSIQNSFQTLVLTLLTKLEFDWPVLARLLIGARYYTHSKGKNKHTVLIGARSITWVPWWGLLFELCVSKNIPRYLALGDSVLVAVLSYLIDLIHRQRTTGNQRILRILEIVFLSNESTSFCPVPNGQSWNHVHTTNSELIYWLYLYI